MICSADRARVMLCPIVKAVTRMRIFFQSETEKTAHNAMINRM